SVNRRKTAQRSRPPLQPKTAKGAISEPAPSDIADIADSPAEPSTVDSASPLVLIKPRQRATVGAATKQSRLSLKAQRNSQIFADTAPILPAELSSSGMADSTSLPSMIESAAAMTPAFGSMETPSLLSQHMHGFVTLPALSSSATAPASIGGSGGLSGTMGALYMPSSESTMTSAADAPSESPLRTVASLRQQQQQHQPGASSGAKRTSSVLFSPSEEQRQRLRSMGLKLYGCAATPKSCTAAFTDSLSLNSHLKLAHPTVASLIPSLNSPGNLPMSAAASTRDALTKAGLKPFRCGMDKCNHAYKNVNGLEYHIFHSRKSKGHLMMDDDSISGKQASDKQQKQQRESDASIESQDVAMYGDRMDFLESTVALQCSEVECLASFDSEQELRQHMAVQHPRPIRRATKPSNRAYRGGQPAVHRMDASSMSPQTPASLGFWSSAINAAMDGALHAHQQQQQQQDQALGTMTTIPESQMSGSAPSSNSSSSSDSAQAATVAAIAAAMGYAASDHGMAQGRAARAHMNMPQSMMFSSTATPGSAHLFANSEPPFISAPALMSSAGGEPTHINSYFALNMSDTSSQNQRQQQHAFTPSLVNGGSSANHSMGTTSASDAQAAASMMFEAISQAAAAAQVGSINPHTPGILHQQTLQSMQPLPPLMSAGSRRNSASALEPEAAAAAMMNQKYVNDMGTAAAAAMDDMPLDMQMVHMFSPFYQNSPSSKEFFHLGDVQMSEHQSQQQQQQQGNNAQPRLSEDPSKERRNNNGSTDMPMVSLGATSAAVAAQMGGFSSSDITGDSSQPNLMTANNNGNNSMAMDIGLGGGRSGGVQHLVNAFNKHQHAGGTSQSPTLNHQQQQQQQNVWSQELTALGGMLPPHTISHDGGTHGLNQGYGNLQRLYTPQPTDLAQFQLFQNHSPHILSAPTSSVNLNGNGNGNNNDDGGPRYQR
ncbi:hypothetical protein LPJ66_010165, partial [Kickxella alabastrina]